MKAKEKEELAKEILEWLKKSFSNLENFEEGDLENKLGLRTIENKVGEACSSLDEAIGDLKTLLKMGFDDDDDEDNEDNEDE